MATEVKLPRLGQGMESGTIVKWLKGEGDAVKKREPLYELDTDKVTQEVEAEADGVLLKILVDAGEVDVGTTIAVIGGAGENVAESLPSADAPESDKPGVEEEDEAAVQDEDEPETEGSSAPAMEDQRERGQRAAAATAAAEEPATGPPPLDTGAARVKASPLARRLAREKGIELAQVNGSGPEGRIVAEDVERVQVAAPTGTPAAAAATGEVEEIQLTSTRKTIARRLTEAWQAPVFQLQVTTDMTRLLHVRQAMVERLREGETKPTVNDLLTKLVAAALVRHPAVNAHFTGDGILRFSEAHVGIAVAAPSGLVVPVLASADRRTVAEIASARADLVGRARNGKLRREDLEGGTFTISNLGMFGIDRFTAVLNPPQAAILAVGQVSEQPVVESGEIVVRPVAHLTLTCDHRAIDGADGAEFLQTLTALVELPGLAI